MTAYLGCFLVWPVIQDLRALLFVPFGLLLSHSYWFTALGLPNSVQLALAAFLAIILFSLPWFSVLSGTRRATVICTFGVIVVLLMQISGCHLQRQKGNATINQAQRACVMQPRVRRTLGIESPHVFIPPNPNGVPSGSTAIASRVSVLEPERSGDRQPKATRRVSIANQCSSPLEIFAGLTTPESAGRPAHSRTLARDFGRCVRENAFEALCSVLRAQKSISDCADLSEQRLAFFCHFCGFSPC